MARFSNLPKAFPAVVLVLSVFPAQAHAYLDPGTGSYIIQIFIAAFLGAVFTAKLYWSRLKSFVKNLFSRDSEDESA